MPKKAQYMVPFIGQPFDAHITGITPFGLFVSLENGIEGLVHISLLTDDEYEFDEATYTMRGRLGGRIYRRACHGSYACQSQYGKM